MRTALALVAALGFVRLSIAAPPARLLYYGWGTPDTTWVAAHCRDVERAPFDGIGIQVALDREAWAHGKTDTGNQLGFNVFGPRALDRASFEPAVRDVRACRWSERDDLLPVAVNTSDQDHGFSWFDDARWATVVHNWEIAVDVARRSGFRGLIVDPESYGAHLFDPATMQRREPHDDATWRAQARARGASLMDATARLFPDVTLLCLFGPSLARRDPQYALWGAFLEGMLEAAPVTATIVDGYEYGYMLRSADDFANGRADVRLAAAPLEGRARTKVEVGFGLWLDYGKRWSATDGTGNTFAPSAFGTVVREALRHADRYVWIYSQVPRFFPPAELPAAYVDAIRAARATAAVTGEPAAPPGRRGRSPHPH